MLKKETPLLAKVLAGIVVEYTLSPIDLIPDFKRRWRCCCPIPNNEIIKGKM